MKVGETFREFHGRTAGKVDHEFRSYLASRSPVLGEVSRHQNSEAYARLSSFIEPLIEQIAKEDTLMLTHKARKEDGGDTHAPFKTRIHTLVKGMHFAAAINMRRDIGSAFDQMLEKRKPSYLKSPEQATDFLHGTFAYLMVQGKIATAMFSILPRIAQRKGITEKEALEELRPALLEFRIGLEAADIDTPQEYPPHEILPYDIEEFPSTWNPTKYSRKGNGTFSQSPELLGLTLDDFMDRHFQVIWNPKKLVYMRNPKSDYNPDRVPVVNKEH